MASLSSTQVRHIAKLARLQISDAEVEKYAVELTAILKYIDQLQEVDTKGIDPTAQVTGTRNIRRADRVTAELASPSDLLATSALPIVDHQIQTPSAHG